MARPTKKLAPASTPPVVPAASVASLHRRRQRVVVRAPGSSANLDDAGDRRAHCPTLSGLGFRDESDTLPAFGLPEDDVEPISCVRVRVTPKIPKAARTFILPPRARPVTLLDEVDDSQARKYREEAERILASGLFDDAERE